MELKGARTRWTFTIREAGNAPGFAAVEANVARWLRNLGLEDVRLARTIIGWRIECLVEGPATCDADQTERVARAFQQFVESGWGPFATGTVGVRVVDGVA